MTVEPELRCCPVPGCSLWFPPDALRSHLLGELHGLSAVEARDFEQRDFARRQYAKLDAAGRRTKRWTLDTFPSDDIAGRRALGQARELLADYAEALNLDGAHVYIDGPTGSGKTGLALGIQREYVAIGEQVGDSLAFPVEFANLHALLDEQKRRFARDESEALDHLLGPDRWTLVVLDDLGAERPTPYVLDKIALIVEHLHTVGAPLIVTTNYSPGALSQRLGRDDPVVGERIVSRLLDGAVRITVDRRDLRVTATRSAGDAPVVPLRPAPDAAGTQPDEDDLASADEGVDA